MFWGLKITFEKVDFSQFLPLKKNFFPKNHPHSNIEISVRDEVDVFEFVTPLNPPRTWSRFAQKNNPAEHRPNNRFFGHFYCRKKFFGTTFQSSAVLSPIELKIFLGDFNQNR